MTGTVRHIGISNFSPAQLHLLLTDASTNGTIPYAHQMELHPYLPQSAWLQYHASHGIHVTAYSPLANATPTYDEPSQPHPKHPVLLEEDAVKSIAKERACTPAQVLLKWGVSRGTSVIPKSKHVARIEENLESYECELEYSDFEELEKLGREPMRFNNPSGSWGLELYEGLEDS